MEQRRLRFTVYMFGAIVLAILSLLIGRFAGGALHDLSHRSESAPAYVSIPPTLATRTLEGDPQVLRLRDRGRPLVLFVLSSECPYCQQNAGRWRRFVAKYQLASQGPEFLVLSVSSALETRTFLESHGLRPPALITDVAELEALDLRGVPATLLIAPDTSRMRRWLGVLDETDLTALELAISAVARPE